jgi:hypothetical protein
MFKATRILIGRLVTYFDVTDVAPSSIHRLLAVFALNLAIFVPMLRGQVPLIFANAGTFEGTLITGVPVEKEGHESMNQKQLESFPKKERKQRKQTLSCFDGSP